MTDKINELLRRVEEFKPKAAAEIEEFRIKVLGKKGELNALMEEFKTVAPELKREMGQQLNKLKVTALDRINALREQLQDAIADDGAATEDMTRPGSAEQLGSRHPISIVKNQIVEVFSRLGYTVAAGPEIEDDWQVFSALNIPHAPPARDMQDTIFIQKARCYCGPTPRRFWCGGGSGRSRRSGGSARAACSATKPFHTAHTASSTRSRASTSTKGCRSPT